MTLAQKRIVHEFEANRFPALKSGVEEAAGWPVPLEVNWDSLAVANDLKEVYAEAKGEGFDTKIIRKVIRLRKADTAKRQEEEALIELYITAIGGL